MSVPDLYKQTVLDHNRAPRHFGTLEAPTHIANGDNPLCGDHLHLELRVNGTRLDAIAFHGEACAIATATASLMSEAVTGRDLSEVIDLQRRFQAVLLMNPDSGEDPALGRLNALLEVRRYPARIKCALLPWATLLAALDDRSAASTDTEG